MELMVEASPRRIFANAHTYHINSISVNSDQETYLSADDLRINLWHLETTDQSYSILFKKEIHILIIHFQYLKNVAKTQNFVEKIQNRRHLSLILVLHLWEAIFIYNLYIHNNKYITIPLSSN